MINVYLIDTIWIIYVLFCKNNRTPCSIQIIERICADCDLSYLYICDITPIITVFFRIVEVDNKCFTDDSTSCAVVLENVTDQDVSRPAKKLYKKLNLNIYIYNK